MPGAPAAEEQAQYVYINLMKCKALSGAKFDTSRD